MAKAYGTGSVFQRTDGRWVAQYYLGKGAKSKTKYRKTKVAAERALREMRRDPALQAPDVQTELCIEEYMLDWLLIYKRPSLKPSSYDRLERTIRGQIIPAVGTLPFKTVNPAIIQQFLTRKQQEGNSYSEVKKIYQVFTGCYRHAIKNRDIDRNPMDIVNAPAAAQFKSPKQQVLSQKEEQALITELNKKTQSTNARVYKYAPVYFFILNTGLRVGEMIALDKQDISLTNKKAYIHKTALYVHPHDKEGKPLNQQVQIVQETPKTASSTRYIPLNEAALEAAKELIQATPDSPYVVTTKHGKRITFGTLHKQLNNALKKSEVPGCGLHALRHTFATRLFEKGANVKVVSELLGHASTTITYNTYIHVIGNQKQDTVNLLD